MSVHRGGDYVQGLVQIGIAREEGPLAAALPLDTPPRGDRPPTIQCTALVTTFPFWMHKRPEATVIFEVPAA
jgi:hypothetical protein